MPRCWCAAMATVVVATPVWLGRAASGQEAAPDLIVVNANVYTGQRPRAQALAMRGARIAAVGDDAELLRLRGPGTRVIDALGRLVIPGINDAHAHWGVDKAGTTLALESMEPGWEDVLQALAVAKGRAPAGSWIFGSIGGRVLDDPRATRSALDTAAPDHPVRLGAWTGHGGLLNSAAMRALGLPSDPPDAADGRVGRDERGRFNGWLFEYPDWRARNGIGGEPRQAAIQGLQAWAKRAAQFGITSLQVMPDLPADQFATLLRDAGVRLRVRIIAFPRSRDEPPRAVVATDRVRLSGIKWILDGTPVERGAALRAPYRDRPASRGFLDFPESFVGEALRAAAARSEQSLFHCAGDRCADVVLGAMEAEPAVDWPARRVRIEHGDGVIGDLIPRAARLGVIVVQNPSHLSLGELARARFGPGHAYQPLRSLLKAGIHVALGSDGPMNPYLNIQLAAAHPARPEEALTLPEALDAYTTGAAFAEHAEAEKGTLAPGQLADLAILSQDIFAVPAERLAATRSVLTLVGGEVVFEAAPPEPR